MQRTRLLSASTARLAFIPLALLTAILSVGCADAPIKAKYAARAAIAEAREAGAEDLAPESLAMAQEAFDSGLREMNGQLQKMRWRRSFARSEAAFGAAIRRGTLAASLSRAARERSRDRARMLLARAEGGFGQMDWFSSYIPPRSPIRSDIRKARVSYTEAVALFDSGRYIRAVAAAQQANNGLNAAYSRFSRLILSDADPAKRSRYERWVRDTIRQSARHDSEAIIVDKMRRTLTLVSNGRRLKTYRAEIGINGMLNKIAAGDRATPEGLYRITQKRGPRQTRWYKALLINYPNEDDLKRFEAARRRGQISRHARPGSLIEIHGEGGRGGDWTDGCVALTNRDIDDLFDRVSVGTPVTIVGFEATDDDLPVIRNGRTASQRNTARETAGTGGR